MAEFPSVTVDLSEQLEFPGDSYPLTGKVDVATYTVGEKEYQLQDGIDYDVVFTNAGTGVLLTGMVRAHATGECDRCLEPASFDIAGEIEEFYLFEEPEHVEGEDDDVEFSLVSEDHTIDLSDAFLSALVMETPFVVLCREDCKGLCPVCGANLNEEDCGHAAQREQERMAASPFAALAGLNLDQEDDGKDA